MKTLVKIENIFSNQKALIQPSRVICTIQYYNPP